MHMACDPNERIHWIFFNIFFSIMFAIEINPKLNVYIIATATTAAIKLQTENNQNIKKNKNSKQIHVPSFQFKFNPLP